MIEGNKYYQLILDDIKKAISQNKNEILYLSDISAEQFEKIQFLGRFGKHFEKLGFSAYGGQSGLCRGHHWFGVVLLSGEALSSDDIRRRRDEVYFGIIRSEIKDNIFVTFN